MALPCAQRKIDFWATVGRILPTTPMTVIADNPKAAYDA
jgi:hypothetical protein